MGLGKTIQSIGLMLSNPPSDPSSPKTTLIVSPLSVLASWRMQIHQFVEPGHWNVVEYRGADREATLRQVKRGSIDVLLVSYDTLVSDFKAYQQFLQEAEEDEAERAAEAAKSNKKAKKSKNSIQAVWKSRGKGNESDESDFELDESEDEHDHYLPKSIMRKQPAKKQPKTWIFDIPLHRIILDEGKCKSILLYWISAQPSQLNFVLHVYFVLLFSSALHS